MLTIRGESLAGIEPAETRCLNSLMSRGVGFGGSCSGVDVGVGGKMVVDAAAICGAVKARSLVASCSVWGGVAFVDWHLGCMFTRLSEQPTVALARIVGLCAVGEVLDGLLTAVLVESVGCFPVDLVLVLLLEALSSSSEEISTTIWADMMGWSFLAGSGISDLEP